MKRLIYVLPVLLALAGGCAKTNERVVPYPTGTFAGEFRFLHKRPGTAIIDTLKTNIQVVLETGVGFKVVGDTSTVHAGSKGHYGVNSSDIAFDDETFPKTGRPAKSHLNGIYRYYYDGSSVFQMVANSSDTLSLQYNLKRVQ